VFESVINICIVCHVCLAVWWSLSATKFCRCTPVYMISLKITGKSILCRLDNKAAVCWSYEWWGCIVTIRTIYDNMSSKCTRHAMMLVLLTNAPTVLLLSVNSQLLVVCLVLMIYCIIFHSGKMVCRSELVSRAGWEQKTVKRVENSVSRSGARKRWRAGQTEERGGHGAGMVQWWD